MSSEHDRERPGSAGDDAAVARAWRQASDEQPPGGLDAAILAAARRSVQENEAGAKTVPVRPRARSRWMQWQPLAAAATVAGLAFMLLQTLPREREVAPPIRMEAPTPGPAASQERLESPPAPESPVAAPVTADTADSLSKAAIEAAERSPARDAVRSRREADMDPRKAVMPEAPPEAATQESASAPMERVLGEAPPPGPVDWPATIAALFASGDTTGAAEALRAFRAVDPDADAQLPESLHEWARTVE